MDLKSRKRIPPLLKRLFDLLVSVLLLILLSPVLLILVLLVWVFMGGPVIFAQRRPGLYGKIFTVYKFRTMRSTHATDGSPLPDEVRLTRLGTFMRSASLDELPELFNVLKGEMSLVGPRPLLIAYLDRYSPEQARRHDVLPGITGWAQVNGRNALSWEDKFKLDVWYVDHWSFWLDIKILFLTVWKVFKRESINAPGSATAPEFMGTLTKNNQTGKK
ncbi:MAG: putative glycosyltransferase [Chloroflexi bacterium]|nr:MAG: putative glycosyltransferase [Chloroflexota bacterium]